jgi:hypothetical protein
MYYLLVDLSLSLSLSLSLTHTHTHTHTSPFFTTYLKGIWNLRGINNNAWHRLPIPIVGEEEDDENDEVDSR